MLELSFESHFRAIKTQALKWGASAQNQYRPCRRFVPVDSDSRLLDPSQCRVISARSPRTSLVIARDARAQRVIPSRITS